MFAALEAVVERNGSTVTVSKRVAEELVESQSEYGSRRERLRAAYEAGWLRPVRPDFTVGGVPGVVDRTRERMATLSAENVTGDEIEKTDTVLAGVAYQQAKRGADRRCPRRDGVRRTYLGRRRSGVPLVSAP